MVSHIRWRQMFHKVYRTVQPNRAKATMVQKSGQQLLVDGTIWRDSHSVRYWLKMVLFYAQTSKPDTVSGSSLQGNARYT